MIIPSPHPGRSHWMKTRYRTVMISDTHLCSRDCHVADLKLFLKSIKCDNLFIVGDLFDIWQLKRKWLWINEYNDIVRRLLTMSKKGTKVVFIPGNHDEVFREFIGTHFGGIEIAANAFHITANGKKLFITHGDEFDNIVVFNKWLANLGSIGYDYLIYVNQVVNWFRRLFGMRYWSFAAYIKRKIKNASVYIGKFKSAVATAGKKQGADGVVCGHIHTPEISTVDGMLYCNTGDWVDSCTALVEHDDGTLEIIHFHEKKNSLASGLAHVVSSGEE